MTRVLSILNRQDVRRIDTALLRRMMRALLRDALAISDYEIGVHLIEAEEMATVNETFLAHHGSTDVITFDHSGRTPAARPSRLHGEIFVSVPDALRQAREFKSTWQGEVVRYVVHGLLHLMGHDDLKPAARRKMKRVENDLVRRAGAVFPISRLARRASARNTRKRVQPR